MTQFKLFNGTNIVQNSKIIAQTMGGFIDTSVDESYQNACKIRTAMEICGENENRQLVLTALKKSGDKKLTRIIELLEQGFI